MPQAYKQPAESQKYSDLENTTTFGVAARRKRDNDPAVHTNQDMFSCGSFARWHAGATERSLPASWKPDLGIFLHVCLLQGIYSECASVLYNEIDYIKEGRNADRFRCALQPSIISTAL